MPSANATYIQSFNCDHQELGKLPMPSVSYSEVSCSSSCHGIGSTAMRAFISLWHCPPPWKNHVSSQTYTWEALCCWCGASWSAFEGWITGPNNGLQLGSMFCHVELMMQAERIFREVKLYWLWFIRHVGRRPFTRIRIRSMEGHFYPSIADSWDLKTVLYFRDGPTVNPKYLCISSSSISTRYRQVPTFGQDTIRRFRENCSELKKMTAWDFEDLLQVCLVLYDHQPGFYSDVFCMVVCLSSFQESPSRTP